MNFDSKIAVKSFTLQLMGAYEPQHRRPYVTNVNGEIANGLAERFAGRAHCTPILIADMSSNIISVSPTPEEDEVHIPNGWGVKRFSFRLVLDVSNYAGSKITEVVSGYTNHEHVDASDFEFYINSIIQIRNVFEQTMSGPVERNYVCENSHILLNHNFNDIHLPNQLHQMRGEDIFASISSQMLISSHSGMGNVVDTRTILSARGVKSHRRNSIPTGYISSILQAYADADNSQIFGTSTEEIYASARGNVASSPASADVFIKYMSAIRGSANLNGTFSLKDLSAIDKDAQEKIAFLSPNVTDQHNKQESWNGSDVVTNSAWILANAVPSLVSEMMLTEVNLTSSNRYTATPATVVSHAKGIDNHAALNVAAFVERFEKEILIGLTYGNTIDYSIQMRVNTIGETTIVISLSGSSPAEYVFPSFCDALLSPVITSDIDTLAGNSLNIDALCTLIANVSN